MGFPFSSRWTLFVVAAVYSSRVLAYTWPNPKLDELESQRYDRLGFNARALASGLIPCDRFEFTNEEPDAVGRLNAADWVRTAYHDMATHDVSDGSGGMDASIRLELDRPENTGRGFQDTVDLLSGESNRYASLADVFALAMVVAVEHCGGPKINYRGGRVDATVANTGRVPLPDEGIVKHISSFQRQGFTQQEMIGLVACGHTFGGVQSKSFPDIVKSGGVVHFDKTFSNFDNSIAHEYLNGTTSNPLVVGPDLTNSDKRIFSSDNNQTMSSFTNPDVFSQTCASLLARMIDTVPKGVQLTEVIEPLITKPQSVALTYMGDGTLLLTGEVRFWDMQEDPTRKVSLKWANRKNQTCSNCSSSLSHTTNQASQFITDNGKTQIQSLWYSFDSPSTQGFTISDSASIGKFWFEIQEGNNKIVEDQNGIGYGLQDMVMISVTSCESSSGLKLDVAVRTGSTPSRVYIEADEISNGLPIVRTVDVTGKPSPLSSLGKNYAIWTVKTTRPARNWNIAADIGGKKYTTSNLAIRGFPAC